MGLLFGPSSFGILLAAGRVGGGWGIANERRWGYQLAVAVAVLPFLLFLDLSHLADHLISTLLVFAFDILLLALLLHPQSRSYQKIWFR